MRWFPYVVYWLIFAVGLVSWWFWPQDFGFAITILLTLISGVFSMIAAAVLLSWKLGIVSLALLLSPWVVLLL